MSNKIRIPQFFSIIILSAGLSNHVLVIPLLIDAAGRDAWISVIIGYLLSIPLLGMLVYVTKNLPNESVFQWLEKSYSKGLSKVIAFVVFFYLFISAWSTLMDTVKWTHQTYLPRTPVFVLALLLLGVSLYISTGKLKVIAICAGVLLPVVILLGIFVAFGTTPDKYYFLLRPVLVENTWKDVWIGTIYIFGSLAELFLIIFFQHRIEKKIRFKHAFILGTLLCILTVGPLIGSLVIFGPLEAGKIRYPAFMQWRILHIGVYFNHLDFLSIYQWLAGSFIRLSLFLYLMTDIFLIQKQKKRIVVQALVCFAFILLVFVPISDDMFLSFLKKYFYSGGTIIAFVITAFLAILVKKYKRGKAYEG
ncbi:endospore germination permease [Virgibacillus sp. LDC-1]|uniref:GerAB/ArcD/ProY family transporter n=1 Tax=Virgibacillus sp. LDC-1 TaxID=3039856 RepID=UPI0024DE3E3F|nr:endospore germination permease [Virgibacillus sp. LDC-1]